MTTSKASKGVDEVTTTNEHNAGELPALPELTKIADNAYAYTTRQMREYAREALAASHREPSGRGETLSGTAAEQIDILRRIAERGKRIALQKEDGPQVDIHQHMLDEIERLAKMVGRPSQPADKPAEESDAALTRTIDERDHAHYVIDKLCDAVLGSDRAEWSSAYGFQDAIDDVEDRIAVMERKPAGQAVTGRDYRADLQRQCVKWDAYWRAPDSHGVILTTAQAVELLEDVLGVEVEFAQADEALAPEPAQEGLAERITDYLCEQEYDIGGREELLTHVRSAILAAAPALEVSNG